MQFGHLNNAPQNGVKAFLAGVGVMAVGTAIVVGGVLGDVYGHEHPNPPNATQLTAHAQHYAQPTFTMSNVFQLAGLATLLLGWFIFSPGLYTIWKGMTNGENTTLVNNTL